MEVLIPVCTVVSFRCRLRYSVRVKAWDVGDRAGSGLGLGSRK